MKETEPKPESSLSREIHEPESISTQIEAHLAEGATPAWTFHLSPKHRTAIEKYLSGRQLGPKEIALGITALGLAVGTGVAVKHFIDTRRREQQVILTPAQQALYDEMYAQGYDAIKKFIHFRVRGDPQIVEDLTQEVFLRAYRRFDKYKQPDAPAQPYKSWLYRIAANTVKNHYRDTARQSKHEQDADDFELEQAAPTYDKDALDKPAESTKLMSALDKLVEDEQLLIFYKYCLDLPDKEVAQLLTRTTGAAKSFQYRTLTKLGRLMRPENPPRKLRHQGTKHV